MLKLTLHKAAYEVMVTGEKTAEYRKPSDWIMSRLKKDHKEVMFVNGYGSTRPAFKCTIIMHYANKYRHKIRYANGLEVVVDVGDIVIRLGTPSVIR